VLPEDQRSGFVPTLNPNFSDWGPHRISPSDGPFGGSDVPRGTRRHSIEPARPSGVGSWFWPDKDGPPNWARDTGYRQDDRQLWAKRVPRPQTICIVWPDHVERWPRADFACA